MILESTVVVFLGLMVMFARLPTRTTLRLLGHPLKMDFVIFVVTYWMHSGSFTGPIVAAGAALMCSMTITGWRWWIGYIDKGVYHPGNMWKNGNQYLE